MARPILKITIPRNISESFSYVIDCLGGVGFSMVSPVSQKIATWNDHGDQLLFEYSDFHEILRKDEQGNLQFWKNANEDIFVHWKKMGDRSKYLIYLDGLSGETQELLISTFSNLILSRLRYDYRGGIAFAIIFE
ncbi:hypothetical protein [Comamonas sp. JNW]|uniref:hypothetical protein n=1 Tax=Comamonas sp. JNW TaxID=2170731 RepID=UPI001057C503|nr:hypothetical protein [Comamonas sp. JNW]